MINVSKKAIAVAIGVAVLLITAIIVIMSTSGSTNSPSSTLSSPEIEPEPIPLVSSIIQAFIPTPSIEGAWYSDREWGDTLMLNTDGTYTSSGWLAPGRYVVDGNSVKLVDVFGTAVTLAIKTQGGSTTLFHNSSAHPHTYYRTPPERPEPRELTEEEAAEIQEIYIITVMQMLTGGEWEYANPRDPLIEKITLLFTDTEYTMTSVSRWQPGEYRQRTDAYTIVSVTSDTRGSLMIYDVEVTVTPGKASWTDEYLWDEGISQSGTIQITLRDNTLTVQSRLFPFLRQPLSRPANFDEVR